LRGWGEGAQTMYTHVSKCKNDKIKEERKNGEYICGQCRKRDNTNASVIISTVIDPMTLFVEVRKTSEVVIEYDS
jgi:hypothetical protein